MNADQRWKKNLRRRDRHWKADKFPTSFGSKYQLHHDWAHGAVVYFLTQSEHDVLTRRGL